MQTRRRFIRQVTAMSSIALLPSAFIKPGFAMANSAHSRPFCDGDLWSLTDGQLSLPLGLVVPDSIDPAERMAFLQSHQLGPDRFTPDCNLTLWRQGARVILFDTGAGTQFPAGGGQLAESLAAASIDPSEITDVVFTHAHPDHLWGVLDDFDDLAFPEAHYHLPEVEWNYWMDANTLDRTPDARKSFVVGAQNRLPLLSEKVTLFRSGDEVLPGVEAVDTRGHTPGHTSFMLHSGSESVLVVGDALTNVAISFERPRWPSGNDQDPIAGVETRLALLDRLVNDKTMLLGFHLPAPGIGYVERADGAYRFVSDV
ncbi:MAG: MBL fold metallo-hydrolase [Granulosicoccus sp.]